MNVQICDSVYAEYLHNKRPLFLELSIKCDESSVLGPGGHYYWPDIMKWVKLREWSGSTKKPLDVEGVQFLSIRLNNGTQRPRLSLSFNLDSFTRLFRFTSYYTFAYKKSVYNFILYWNWRGLSRNLYSNKRKILWNVLYFPRVDSHYILF